MSRAGRASSTPTAQATSSAASTRNRKTSTSSATPSPPCNADTLPPLVMNYIRSSYLLYARRVSLTRIGLLLWRAVLSMSTSPFVLLPSSHARAHDSFLEAEQLAEQLRANIRGEVRFDPSSRALYATDASNYRHIP